MLAAEPGTGFVSLSHAIAGGVFPSSGVNAPSFFFWTHHWQYKTPIVPHTVSHKINNYYNLIQIYGDCPLQL